MTRLRGLACSPANIWYFGILVIPGQLSSVGLPSNWKIFISWSSSSIPEGILRGDIEGILRDIERGH